MKRFFTILAYVFCLTVPISAMADTSDSFYDALYGDGVITCNTGKIRSLIENKANFNDISDVRERNEYGTSDNEENADNITWFMRVVSHCSARDEINVIGDVLDRADPMIEINAQDSNKRTALFYTGGYNVDSTTAERIEILLNNEKYKTVIQPDILDKNENTFLGYLLDNNKILYGQFESFVNDIFGTDDDSDEGDDDEQIDPQTRLANALQNGYLEDICNHDEIKAAVKTTDNPNGAYVGDLFNEENQTTYFMKLVENCNNQQDLSIIEWVLENAKPANYIDMQDKVGYSALYYIYDRDSDNTVCERAELLIKHGAHDVQDIYKESILDKQWFDQNEKQCIRDAFEKYKSSAQPDTKTNNPAQRMLRAALVDDGGYMQCKVKEIKDAINAGANVNDFFEKESGETYFMTIVQNCSETDEIQVIDYILKNKEVVVDSTKAEINASQVAINATDTDGHTALFYTVKYNGDKTGYDRAKMLIDAGADTQKFRSFLLGVPDDIEPRTATRIFNYAKEHKSKQEQGKQQGQDNKEQKPQVDTRNECEKKNAAYTVCDVMDNECVLATECEAQEKINQAKAKLTAIENAHLTKKSVWKDENGEFNTARLASDSVAGAVLGTAGGIITNSVIKKNQTEKGLESVRCYIGARPLARFGDKMYVGK